MWWACAPVPSECSAEQRASPEPPEWRWLPPPEQGLLTAPSAQLPGESPQGLWQQRQVDLEELGAALTWSDPAPPSGFSGIPDPGRVATGQCLML